MNKTKSKFRDIRIKIKFLITKIIKRNRLLRPFLVRHYESSDHWGLAVFIIRQPAIKLELLTIIREMIKERNFDFIDLRILKPAEKKNMALRGRGGFWPNNGPPEAIAVVFDPQPERPDSSNAFKYPELDNIRVLVKLEMRVELNALLPESNRANFIHATDNSYQAWEYINFCDQEYVQEIRNKIESLYKVCPVCGPGNYLDKKSTSCDHCLFHASNSPN